MESRLSEGELLKLRRMNTPTVYNGWAQITQADVAGNCFNQEATTDYMPQLGAMVGYAITVVIEPSNPAHKASNKDAVRQYREYVASIPGPKIVVIQDLDKPRVVGSFWGEVNSTLHRALGCVGTIVDGGVRDVEEMAQANFKALARRMCIGNAHSTPVKWGCEVEVFGAKIRPGQLIHADQHGFLAVPEADEGKLLKAAAYMDDNEFDTVIAAAWNTAGTDRREIVARITEAAAQFGRNTKRMFDNQGEW